MITTDSFLSLFFSIAVLLLWTLAFFVLPSVVFWRDGNAVFLGENQTNPTRRWTEKTRAINEFIYSARVGERIETETQWKQVYVSCYNLINYRSLNFIITVPYRSYEKQEDV